MVLIDASTRWTHVCSLSTQNKAFAKFIAKLIELRARFPDYPFKSIRMDNASEFTSKAFDDYCMKLDPHTSQTELEVQKIINLQYLESNMLDAFTDHKGVTKSHIPTVNTPQRVEVPKGSSIFIDAPQC